MGVDCRKTGVRRMGDGSCGEEIGGGGTSMGSV